MNLINSLLVGGLSLAMLYTGLLFNPAWANLRFLQGKMQPFAAMVLVNYLAVPLLAVAMTLLLPVGPTLALTLLTLAALPCAPLVPALVTLVGEAPEWPLFVFLGFSLLSLLVVVALIAALSNSLANSATYAANIGTDTAAKLLHYLLLVYGPMLLGALLRLLVPGPAQRMINPVRMLTGISLIGIMMLFATVHHDAFAGVSGNDLLLILGFVLGCTLLGAMLNPGFSGSRLTAIMSTCFRNIALGIAFATVVLRRPDVTAYLVIYSAITLPVCGAVMVLHRLLAARRHAHG